MPSVASMSWASLPRSFLAFPFPLPGLNRLSGRECDLRRTFRWSKDKQRVGDVRREIPVAELGPELWLALGLFVGNHQPVWQRLVPLRNPELQVCLVPRKAR